MENFILIYLDNQLHDNNTFISQLNHQFDFDIQRFNECDSCIDYITDLNSSVLLILPSILSETLVPFIHDLRQLVSIYIIYESINEDEDWTKNWKKVRKMFKDTPLTFNQLNCRIRHFNETSVPVTLIKSLSISNYDELGPSIMYSLLLKECIVQTIYDDNATKNFANFCRENCDILNVSLKEINNFEENYKQSNYYGMYSPVWWYTKKSFIYSVLNQALRTQNTEVILLMSFFIQDLYIHLRILKMKSHQLSKMIVYRGQGMSNDELENVKNSKNGLLSFNNFLSTSEDRDVSYAFADSTRQNENLVGILFVIKIDPSNISAVYVSLDDISAYKGEQEILFSMNTIFRIGEVKQIEYRFWEVNLTLTDDNDEQLIQFMKHIENKINDAPRGFYRMGKLMLMMGEVNKATEIFNALLERIPDNEHEKLAFIHHLLGSAHHINEDIPKALIHYEKCLSYLLEFLPSNDPEFSTIYSNIGLCFKEQNKLDEALEYSSRALNVNLNASTIDQLDTATRYNNIGAILHDQAKYSEALESYERASKIYLEHLPRHSGLGKVFNNIGRVYISLGDIQTALSYFEEALKIFNKSLSSNDPLWAVVHFNLAYTLKTLGRYSEAVKHAEQSVKVARNSFKSDHSCLQLYQDFYNELQHIEHNHIIEEK